MQLHVSYPSTFAVFGIEIVYSSCYCFLLYAMAFLLSFMLKCPFLNCLVVCLCTVYKSNVKCFPRIQLCETCPTV